MNEADKHKRLTSFRQIGQGKYCVSFSEYDESKPAGFTCTGRAWEREVNEDELFSLFFPNQEE